MKSFRLLFFVHFEKILSPLSTFMYRKSAIDLHIVRMRSRVYQIRTLYMSNGSYIYENGHLNKVNMCCCPVQRYSSTVFALINPATVNKRPYIN